MTNWIIVPEGLAITSMSVSSKPSFVYKAVLDYVLKTAAPFDNVYLAPANYFGGVIAEDEAAAEYLKLHNPNFIIHIVNNINRSTYIDTYGNAKYLKQAYPFLVNQPSIIISGKYHRLRSYICFKYLGFDLIRSLGVSYTHSNQEKIVNRLFYYHHPVLHLLYETLAIVRDLFRMTKQQLLAIFS